MKKLPFFRIILIFIPVLLFYLITPAIFLEASKSKQSEEIQKYIEEGQELFDKGDYQGAIDKWAEALKIDPWNEEVKGLIDKALKKMSGYADELNRALKLINEGKLDEASKVIEKLDKVVKPENKDVYAILKKSKEILKEKQKEKKYMDLLKSGDESLKKGELEKAEEYYRSAMKLYPQRDDAKTRLAKISRIKAERERQRTILELKKRGEELFDNNELEEARKVWQKVLELSPDDSEAKLFLSKIDFKQREKERLLALGKSYFETGVRLFKSKKYKEALDQFENAIAVNYNVQEAKNYIVKINQIIAEIERKRSEEQVAKIAEYLREGIRLYNLNRFKDALKVLNEGLKLDPENDQIKEYIVRVSVAIKRQEEKRVPPTSPFYPLVENLKRLGIQAYKNGNYGESIKYWEEILLIFPFNEDARINLTKTLKRTDPKLASDILKDMLNEAKDLLQRGKDREALAKVKTILEVDPNFSEARALFKKLNEKLESKKRIITEEMKEKAKVLYDRGVEAYQKEELEKAISFWKEALSLYPDYVDVRIALARAETQWRNLKRIGKKGGTESLKTEEISIKIKKHYIDGLNYYMNGLYREAISEWEQILKIRPDDEKIKQNIMKAKKRLELQSGRVS